MNIRLILLSSAMMILALTDSSVAKGHKRDKKDSKTEKSAPKKKDTAYDKLFKDKKVVTERGMITLHNCEGKIYFEMPRTLLGRDMLVGSAIAATTDNQFGSVGEKPRSPMHMRFVQVDSTITLRWVPTGTRSDDDNINQRIMLSSTPAVMASFPIKAYSNDSTAVVFDMSSYLLEDNKYMPPFSPFSPLEMMGADISKSFEKENSRIADIKAFADNISVRTTFTYKVSIRGAVKDMPFTTDLTRSFILLPEEPMRMRYADPRINIFFDGYTEYSPQGRGVKSHYIANRWRVEPSDVEAYKRGEMVEPAKPIVFYVDDAFPENWKQSVKRGVERWQKAFEKIGFRNAIVAKDFPKGDSTFDPDNIKYSCVRYSPSTIGNAMGPSWTDPRSGEIINASVYIYHNIVEVVQAWRFLQTAPADPDVRTVIMSDSLLQDCIEYVVAHEVGHCLSFMHNMSGSSAIPVDSLRSPSFTQTYGTTYSIMDYARNNYVAQPGDKERGVRLTPPFLGQYDYFSVKWLYTPLLDAATARDEVPTLDRWISEKSGDPAYRYGKQQFGERIDPSSVEEDLGDDPVKAGEYGVKNLKYLMANMNDWVAADDKDFEFRELIYSEMVYQYVRYLSNVLSNVGGIYLNERYDGDKLPSYSTVSKADQKRSLQFLLGQLSDASWIDNPEFFKGFPIRNQLGGELENSIIQGVLRRTLAVSRCAAKADPKERYTQQEYLADIADFVWKPTREGRSLTNVQKKIQMQYISTLIGGSISTVEKNANSRAFAAERGFIAVPESVKAMSRSRFGVLPNSVLGVYNNLPQGVEAQTPEQISGFSYEVKLAAPAESVSHIYYAELRPILSLVRSRANTGNEDTRKHYKLLIYKLEQALK